MKTTRGLLFLAGIVYFAMSIRSAAVDMLPIWVTVGFVIATAVVGAMLVSLPVQLNSDEKKIMVAGYATGVFTAITIAGLILFIIVMRTNGLTIRPM